MIYKLQRALNSKGLRILSNRSQFYSEDQNRPVTIYKVSQSRPDGIKKKHVELFSSASQIQIVLFLRNLWYVVNGKPVPKTNRMKGSKAFDEAWKQFENAELQNCLSQANKNSV
jgi:hypothetical protein